MNAQPNPRDRPDVADDRTMPAEEWPVAEEYRVGPRGPEDTIEGETALIGPAPPDDVLRGCPRAASSSRT